MASIDKMNSSADEREDFDISPADTMYGYEGWKRRLKMQRDIKQCRHRCSETSGDNTPYLKISIFGIICFLTGVLLSSAWRQQSTL